MIVCGFIRPVREIRIGDSRTQNKHLAVSALGAAENHLAGIVQPRDWSGSSHGPGMTLRTGDQQTIRFDHGKTSYQKSFKPAVR
jgi:hypothetical protein